MSLGPAPSSRATLFSATRYHIYYDKDLLPKRIFLPSFCGNPGNWVLTLLRGCPKGLIPPPSKNFYHPLSTVRSEGWGTRPPGHPFKSVAPIGRDLSEFLQLPPNQRKNPGGGFGEAGMMACGSPSLIMPHTRISCNDSKFNEKNQQKYNVSSQVP